LASPATAGFTYGPFLTCGNGNNVTTSNGQDYIIAFCPTVNGCFKLTTPASSPGDVIIQTKFIIRAYDSCNFTSANLVAADSLTMPPSYFGLGPEITFNAIAGKCYYFVFDANDQGSNWGDCIKFNANFTLFALTSTQTPGSNTCAGSSSQQSSFNTNIFNQKICCVGNTYVQTAGNDWWYSFCAPYSGCALFNLDSVITTDNVPSSNFKFLLFDTCWANAQPVTTGTISATNSTYSAGGLQYTVDSGKCYYLLVTSDNEPGSGGCFDYTVYTSLTPLLAQTPGALTCAASQLATQVVPGVYYGDQTNCCSGAQGLPKKDKWYYTYCATFDGCAWFGIDSTNLNVFDTAMLYHLVLTDACGDTVREAYRATPEYSLNLRYFLYFDVEAGHCYNLLVETDTISCLTFGLMLEANPTAPPNSMGSNDTFTHCNVPLQHDSVYQNQTTCCLGDNYQGDFGKDWYYCISPDISGCIEIEIDSITSGTPPLGIKHNLIAADSAWLNVQDVEDGLIIMDVDSLQNYKIILDTKLINQERCAPCFNYNISWRYVDSTINTQWPGGNTLLEASQPANLLQANVWYTNQTTCCAKNDFLFQSGMDWVYRFCAPQKGCFGLVLHNWWSSDSNKSTFYDIWINEDAVNGVAREYEFVIQAGDVIADTLFFTGDSGTCFNIYMDAFGGNREYTGCYNYDLLILDQYPAQLPGGQNNIQASATCVTQGDTVFRHNTCCTGYNNNLTGQDWRYCFIPPASGVYRASIFELSNRDATANFSGRISHFVGNNTNASSTSLSANLPPLAIDPVGTSVTFCADSGVAQYLHVDDNRANAQNACMDYDFVVENYFIPVPPASNLGGPSLASACTVPLPLIDTTINGFTSCCFPNVRFYKFCADKNMCVKYTLKNFMQEPPSAGFNVLASSWYAMNSNNNCNINGGLLGTSFTNQPITFHVDSGQCYILRINNLQGGCGMFDMDFETNADETQSPGGSSCATAQLLPITLSTVLSNHTNCLTNCVVLNNHSGANLQCVNPNTPSSDYTYLLKPNQLGLVTVRLDSLRMLDSSSTMSMMVSVYKACNGSNYTNNVANAFKVITGTTNDTLNVSFMSQSLTDSFYIVLDGTAGLVNACYRYDLSSSIQQLQIGCNNAGFEDGNTSRWQLSLGNSTPGCTNCACPAPQYSTCPTYVNNSTRHTITSSGTDFYGGFPQVYSGNHSIKLGDALAGALAEGMTLYYVVDSTNTSFTYNYAVVFQDPGHGANSQPFFRAKIMDPNGAIIPCTEFCVSAQNNVPGFSVSPNSGSVPVYYKPWSTVTVDLSAYVGNIVKIEFEGGDCSDGGHFGYAYVDCSCDPIIFNDNDTLCSTNCDTLFAPTGYASYSWQPGGDTTNYKIICVNSDTTVTLTYTTYNGCTLQKTYNLHVQPGFTVSSTTSCWNSNTITAFASVVDTSFTYIWQTTPPQLGKSLDSVTVGNVYTVQVSDGVCYTSLFTVTAMPNYPSLIIDSTKPATCFGLSTGSVFVSASQGTTPYAYTVNGVAGVTTLSNLAAGTYSATVADSNLCKDTTSFTIIQPPVLGAQITTSTPCIIGQQNVTATALPSGGTAPYVYAWSNSANTASTQVGAGVHTVTVTDAKACTTAATISLVSGLNVIASVVDSIACAGDSNGIVAAVIPGVTSSITYSWNTVPATLNDSVSNLSAGTFIVTATDTSGCTGMDTIVLVNPPAFVVTTASNGSCIGEANGSASASVGGGTIGYTFMWLPDSATTASITNLVSGTYTVTASNAKLCTATATVQVAALASPSITISPASAAFCVGTVVPVSASGANTYTYYTDSFITALTPPLTLSTDTSVIVVGIASNGCRDTSSVTYTANAVYNTTTTASICEGQSFSGYTTSGVYNTTFQSIAGCDSVLSLALTVHDTFYASVSASICQGQLYNGYGTTGVYNTVYTSAFGCDSTLALNLTVNPVYSIDTTTLICLGDSLFYNGSWYSSSTIVTDTFTTYNGCDSVVRFDIRITPFLLPVITGDSTICVGDTAILYCVGGSYDNYLWSTGSITNSTSISNAGTYSLLVSNDNSVCIGTASFTANVYPLPEITEVHDQRVLCLGDTVVVYPSGADSLYYSIGNSSNFTKVSNGSFKTIIQSNPQLVYLKGISDKGCIGYDTITMYYADCCGTLIMPNAFTPGNGDGVNDVYKVLVDNSQPVKYNGFNFSIYNRWGQRLFETTTPLLGWDGTYKGTPVDMGTYYYVIRLRCTGSDREKVFKGDVLLLR
jgi:gliding motility-associated-like protein